MAIKHSKQFSELEFCIDRYFNAHIASVMDSTQRYLSNKCAEEIGQYSNSFAGIVSSMAGDIHGAGDTSFLYLKTAGKWNSKTTDDYLDMVRKNISKDKDIQKDLVLLSNEWRKAVVSEVGRDAYDAASRQIGTDLSYAYIEYRMEQMMMDRLVSQRMPSSSIEYVMKKAAEGCIFGLPYTLGKTATDYHIDEKTEARNRPCIIEKGAARAASFGIDALSMGGIGSWGALAKLAGAEVVFTGLEAFTHDKKNSAKNASVEECISRGVFKSDRNVFSDFRKDSRIYDTWEHPNIIAIDRQLKKRMGILQFKPLLAEYMPKPQKFTWDIKMPTVNREGIPMVVAIGKEEEYRKSMKQQQEMERQQKKQPVAPVETPPIKEESPTPVVNEKATDVPVADVQDMPKEQENNLSGWDTFLGSMGLDGLSAVGSNLGYVIAMLPDVLFGAFTGKSESLKLENNLLPIASVLAGLFVKNPLLKMTLIGIGGANLLNKAGHEALETSVQPVQYKRYADEPLDPRISDLSIHGNTLLCSIDRVPSSISLPATTIGAYEAGALPLNTLANAILARHDAMQHGLQENMMRQYEESMRQQNHQGIR